MAPNTEDDTMRKILRSGIVALLLIVALVVACGGSGRATTADIQRVRDKCGGDGGARLATVITTKHQRAGKGRIGPAMPGDPVGSLRCVPWGSAR